MAFAGSAGEDLDGFKLEGKNLIEGFKKLGYLTLGTGAVAWFDTNTETGSVLAEPFDCFWYSGNTWSLLDQLHWIFRQLENHSNDQPIFLFLNVGETHVPYWHKDATWDKWPSPCVPFGSSNCSRRESRRRQLSCLEWVDEKICPLIRLFQSSTILACADHGDCWGENGLWEHGISHPATLTVPLLLRVRGKSI